MSNPGFIIERKWYCPRWLFWRLKGYWSFWMTRTEIKHDSRAMTFLRGGPMGSELDSLAPGVMGKVFYEPLKRRFNVIMVYAENEGQGAVGKWLDSLGKLFVISCVTSNVLVGMLMRRGWIPTWEKVHDGYVDVWVHPEAIKLTEFDLARPIVTYERWEQYWRENEAIKKSMKAAAGL